MPAMPVLKQGAVGDAVATLQRLLNQKITPSPNLVVDGKFGPTTKAIVRAFQKHHAWFQGQYANGADGTVHPKTWAALGVKPDHETWREIIRFLDSKRIPHWNPQPNQTIAGAHSNTSLHYLGVSVDLNPSVEIFKALLPLAEGGGAHILAELYLHKPGCGFYKHGHPCPLVPGHDNHCHVALEIGRHMPIIGVDYDQRPSSRRVV